MDNKKKLTDDELEKVAGGYDSDMFYEDHRKEVTDEFFSFLSSSHYIAKSSLSVSKSFSTCITL